MWHGPTRLIAVPRLYVMIIGKSQHKPMARRLFYFYAFAVTSAGGEVPLCPVDRCRDALWMLRFSRRLWYSIVSYIWALQASSSFLWERVCCYSLWLSTQTFTSLGLYEFGHYDDELWWSEYEYLKRKKLSVVNETRMNKDSVGACMIMPNFRMIVVSQNCL